MTRPQGSFMKNHTETKTQPEKVVVLGIGLKSQNQKEIKDSLYELEDLVVAAGGEVVGALFQQLPKFHPATLMGSGKLQELKVLVEETQAQLVIVDHGLSGVQARNLEEEFKVPVLDRSQLILDIFAQRAQTYEGKLQVELAQMMDQLPRMVGGWHGSLSRLGGGIGTRGPGESALEIDRRRAREKIQVIKEKLEQVRKNRQQHRAKRKRQKVHSFALIGYTNAGKSTLLNRLAHSDVLSKDQLFATLDPTTRKLYLPHTGDAVITDTVGFIRHLPTHLIEAFKATLEESGESDVLLHVVDLSSDQMESQMAVVQELIQEFQWQHKPIIHVFNKVDKSTPDKKFKVQQHPRVFISAKTGEGIEELKQLMEEQIQNLSQEVSLYFSKEQEPQFYELQREAKVLYREPGPQGTLCVALLTELQIQRWSEFISH